MGSNRPALGACAAEEPYGGAGLAIVAIVAACALPYLGTLRAADFIQDDRVIVAGNALLAGSWSSLGKLLTTGYWEAVWGEGAAVQEYRPVLMLSFFLHRVTTGLAAAPMHAANIALHALVCVLLFQLLRRRMELSGAAVAALFYAVMPVHTEAVSSLTGRSELMSAAFMLGAWLALDDEPGADVFLTRARATGCLLYLAGAMTKEHALLFPALLAMSDWAFHGRSPLARERRDTYAALLACACCAMTLRAAVLSRTAHVGLPYFQHTPWIGMILTLSRFFVLHYAWPTLAGSGFCADYSRPLIPDSGVMDAAAWLCLIGLLLVALTAWRAFQVARSPWSFWVLAPCLFLLPTSHLIVPIDTLGAERFLYFPTIGLASLLGGFYSASRRDLPGVSAAWAASALLAYGIGTFQRNAVWTSELRYYAAATACNPVSAKARTSLGTVLIQRGRLADGEYHLAKAVGLDPDLALPHYNLARLAWGRHDLAAAETSLRRCLRLEPAAPDAWVLLAVVLEAAGKKPEAALALERALTLRPWDPLAHYNIARLHLQRGQDREAAGHFARFLELAPDDSEAGAIAELLRELERKAGRRPEARRP